MAVLIMGGWHSGEPNGEEINLGSKYSHPTTQTERLLVIHPLLFAPETTGSPGGTDSTGASSTLTIHSQFGWTMIGTPENGFQEQRLSLLSDPNREGDHSTRLISDLPVGTQFWTRREYSTGSRVNQASQHMKPLQRSLTNSPAAARF